MKKTRVLATKIDRILSIKEGEIYGTSDKLKKLIEETKRTFKGYFSFEDIRLHRDNPHLRYNMVVTANKEDSITVYLDPSNSFEDDIAHELFHIRINAKFPQIRLRPEKDTLQNEIFSYLGDKIFSGLVDFEIDRLIKESGFDPEKSIERDKISMMKEWEKDIPYNNLPFKYDNNRESLRNVEAGIVFAQFCGVLNPREKDYIQCLIKNKLPESLKIAYLFYLHGSKGWKSREEFETSLRDILGKLNLNNFLEIVG